MFKQLTADGFEIKDFQKKFSLQEFPSSDFLDFKKTTFKAKELVFIGEISITGGIKDFCDAIDSILQSGIESPFKITFIGGLGTINGLDSKEYIQLRSLKWDSQNIEWGIKDDISVRNALNYVGTDESGRLAIIPSLSDFSSVVKSNFDAFGAPYVENNLIQKITDSLNKGGKKIKH